MADFSKHQTESDIRQEMRRLQSDRIRTKRALKDAAQGMRARPGLAPPQSMMDMFPHATHPWTAAKFVSELERRHFGAVEWLENAGWEPVADALLGDDGKMPEVPMTVSSVLQYHLQMTAQEVAVHRLWGRYKVVFDVHPGLTRHLRSSSSDKFPPMVLQSLTHINPVVFLEEPVSLRDSAGKPVRLIGWYVAGMSARKGYIDTTDPRAQSFHLTTISEVLSQDEKEVIDWDHCRITLPVTGSDATVGELIEQALDAFQWDPTVSGQTQELQRQFISDLLYVAVPHMLYLVSQGLETQPKPFHTPAAPKKNSWEKKRGGGKVIRQLVGFRTGPALAAMDRWGDDVSESREPRGLQGLRRSPVAHMRRAHFHTFLAGPRDAPEREKRVKWLPPIPVNAEGSPTETVAVKIK